MPRLGTVGTPPETPRKMAVSLSLKMEAETVQPGVEGTQAATADTDPNPANGNSRTDSPSKRHCKAASSPGEKLESSQPCPSFASPSHGPIMSGHSVSPRRPSSQRECPILELGSDHAAHTGLQDPLVALWAQLPVGLFLIVPSLRLCRFLCRPLANQATR